MLILLQVCRCHIVCLSVGRVLLCAGGRFRDGGLTALNTRSTDAAVEMPLCGVHRAHVRPQGEPQLGPSVLRDNRARDDKMEAGTEGTLAQIDPARPNQSANHC